MNTVCLFSCSVFIYDQHINPEGQVCQKIMLVLMPLSVKFIAQWLGKRTFFHPYSSAGMNVAH